MNKANGPVFIVVTGGVISSVGKGVASGVISDLLQGYGYKTRIKKFDPYLNIDPGILSPMQHGEVYVTQDGAETDLDAGHYERIGNVTVGSSDYTTMGQVMHWIISSERKGGFCGNTVQVIPHVTDRIKERFLEDIAEVDIVICEIGGTVGDIEGRPFLEAARQLKQEYKRVLFVHIGCVVQPSWVHEPKTKPLQHSVSVLQQYGIHPDILGCRVENRVASSLLCKLSVMCGVEEHNVVAMPNARNGFLYSLPQQYDEAGLGVALVGNLERLGYACPKSQKRVFKKFDCLKPNQKRIGIVTKYFTSEAHQSLQEALLHACVARGYLSNIVLLDAECINEQDLSRCDGIIVAGGFGRRGIEGKLRAIRYARVNQVPYLGICLGMQLAVIESLRAFGVDADSVEFVPKTNFPAVCLVKEWQEGGVTKVGVDRIEGGTLRLGGHPCSLVASGIAHRAYQASVIYPRHRHRYEINPNFEEDILSAGMCITGRSANALIEIVERADHPWFVGVQYHPEFSSRLDAPERVINAFVGAVSGQ